MSADLRLAIAFLVGLFIGLGMWSVAHAQQDDAVAPHDWISANPNYTIPPAHTTHCCGPSHCQPARKLGVTVTRVPSGGYMVAGGPLAKATFVPEGYVYQTEAEGNGEYWVCIGRWLQPGHQVMCLFVPPTGM